MFRRAIVVLMQAFGVVALLVGAMYVRDLTSSFSFYSVQSDSMRPSIPKGALIVVDKQNSRLVEGNIISYVSPIDHTTINTHRVIKVRINEKTVITKGDNLQQADNIVPVKNIIGSVRLSIPIAGNVLDFLKSPVGLTLCIYLPAIMIVWHEVQYLLRTLYSPPRLYRLYGSRKFH